MTAPHRLRLAADYGELQRLAQETETFLEGHEVPPAAAYSVQLALEEVVTNVIKYGFDDDGPHEIAVSMEVVDGHVELSVEDDGHEFDPLSAQEPDLDASLEERPVGGLGLHLVRQMVDRIAYDREAGTNRVRIWVGLAERADP